MKKREWLIVMLPLVLVWVVDRLSKVWASKLTENLSYLNDYLHFALHHNHGAMLGLFSNLPIVLRVVTLSTAGAFLLCIYGIIQYLLPIKSLTLRTGLSILLGGIIGNVTDRIVWGYVVDFIIIGTPSLSSAAFNIADALQWIGYILIVTAIVREGDLLWPENNSRKVYWVNRSFQLKYCLMLMGVGLGLTLICAVFSYTYLRVTILELVGNNVFLMSKFLVPFTITFAIIAVAFAAILFSVGKQISHKIAGPLYAFERFLNDSLSGAEPPPLKLRAGDEFRHLEELATEISLRLKTIRDTRTVNVVEFTESGKIESQTIAPPSTDEEKVADSKPTEKIED